MPIIGPLKANGWSMQYSNGALKSLSASSRDCWCAWAFSLETRVP